MFNENSTENVLQMNLENHAQINYCDPHKMDTFGPKVSTNLAEVREIRVDLQLRQRRSLSSERVRRHPDTL